MEDDKTAEEVIAEAEAKDYEEIQPTECQCTDKKCHILYALIVALVVVVIFTSGVVLFSNG